MEGRWGCLILKAYTTGALDLKDYRRGDPLWDLKESIVLQSLENDKLISVMEARVSMLQAVISSPHAENAKKTFEDTASLIRNLCQLHLPWYEWPKAQSTVDDMIRLWRQMKEDAQRPEVKERLKAKRDAMRKRRKDTETTAETLVAVNKDAVKHTQNLVTSLRPRKRSK